MLSKKMAELRKKRSLKLKELAAALGVSTSAISLYEMGERRPDYNTLLKISDFYDVTVDYLLKDEPVADENDKSKLLQFAYMRVIDKAKEKGIPPEDLEMAMDFLVRAKQRDDGVN